MNSEHRLKREQDITSVLKSKKGVFDSACGVKVAKNDLSFTRFAIVVSTKVSKNAVDRNKIRRQYREILSKHIDNVVPGFDVLLLASKPALELDFSQKESKLLHVFRKAGLLKG